MPQEVNEDLRREGVHEPEDKQVLMDEIPSADTSEVSQGSAVKSFIVSFLVMLVSIPASDPDAGLCSSSASLAWRAPRGSMASRTLSHSALPLLSLLTSANLKWGPFYMILVATVAVMMDLLRHVLLDAVNWYLIDPATGKQYKFHLGSCVYQVASVAQGKEGTCPDLGAGPLQVVEENALGVHMSMYNSDGSYSFYGIFFTIILTYLGYILMFVSIAWYTSLPRKLATQCRSLNWRGCWAGCRAKCCGGGSSDKV
ncbi:hypothetical protein FOL47_003379 [Perkinsus chesapeaki]|uniref:Uncharacterized protein n=1 Tax=Perkinsus chesapeaki TaxID=330153 RepID=A0A7J6M9B4_PERCH|nr:hypothetical protein FOL47_003379 [Perkinsus chesapeaki]